MGFGMLSQRDYHPRVGVIVATNRELGSLRAVADDPRFIVCLAGIGPGNAVRAARRLIESECGELMSWGMAGALHAAVAPGALIRPSLVVDAESETRYPVAGGDPGMVMISSPHVAGAREKRRLAAAHPDASAVDMESAAIARECHRHGVPLRICRAISDALEDGWIDVAAGLIDTCGRLRPARILQAAACRPGALIAARRGSARAVAALAGQARLLAAG